MFCKSCASASNAGSSISLSCWYSYHAALPLLMSCMSNNNDVSGLTQFGTSGQHIQRVPAGCSFMYGDCCCPCKTQRSLVGCKPVVLQERSWEERLTEEKKRQLCWRRFALTGLFLHLCPFCSAHHSVWVLALCLQAPSAGLLCCLLHRLFTVRLFPLASSLNLSHLCRRWAYLCLRCT